MTIPPAGGKSTSVSVATELLGQSHVSLPISFLNSTVIGLELVMDSTSTKNVAGDSSHKMLPRCFVNADNMTHADLIYSFQTLSKSFLWVDFSSS